MRKALLLGGLAVAAVAGAIVAVILSSGGDKAARPAASQPPSIATTAQASSGTTTAAAPPSITTALPTTTSAIPPAPGPNSPRRHRFTVGVVDDSLAQQVPASARTQVEKSQRAGFDAVALSAVWTRGRTRPQASVMRGIRNAANAAQARHMRLFLDVWNGFAAGTPRNGAEREQFASFAAALARAFPHAAGIVVGNEPNLVTFWTPQFGPGGRDVAAVAYEDLLARSYDAIKAAEPSMRVIGVGLSPRGADRPHGIRPTHSPTTFIRDLGRVYRTSGRRKPLMDAFAIHPYMLSPKVPPTVAHPKTTQITLADYPKLVTLLDEAFRGTPQRGRTLPILYTEFGVQTVVPGGKLAVYQRGTNPKAEQGVSPSTQVAYYRTALALAYCQPTVRGLFIFHTFDESSLDGWQSGLYYADGTPKPSASGFHRAVTDLRKGKLTTCGR